MSYAAESYPYIAKQVLASLTGGAVRETHRFLAVLNASGFSTERPTDDVVSESIIVAGLSSGTFKVFARVASKLLRFPVRDVGYVEL